MTDFVLGTVAAATLLVGGLCAQKPLDARSFFPPEYGMELYVDLAAMRDNGLWDGVSRLVRATGELVFFEHFGFRLTEVDSVHLVLSKRSDSSSGIPAEWMIAVRGSETVGLPDFGGVWSNQEVQELEIGRHTVYRKAALNHELGDLMYVVPSEGLLICGNEALISGILSGRLKPGVPAPELLTLTHAPRTLAYFVGASELLTLKGVLGVLPLGWRREADPMTWFMMRLREDRPDENVRFEAAMRFEYGTEGLASLREAVDDGLVWLVEHPRLAGLRHYWRRVEITRRDRSLEVGMDLGRPRAAAQHLIQLVTPLWVWAATSGEVVIPVESVPVAGKKKDKKN